VIPALRKVREERGTRCVDCVGEVKGPGHPPETTNASSVAT
jgi:hypothetical protein